MDMKQWQMSGDSRTSTNLTLEFNNDKYVSDTVNLLGGCSVIDKMLNTLNRPAPQKSPPIPSPPSIQNLGDAIIIGAYEVVKSS